MTAVRRDVDDVEWQELQRCKVNTRIRMCVKSKLYRALLVSVVVVILAMAPLFGQAPAFNLPLGDNSQWFSYGGSMDWGLNYRFPCSIFYLSGGIESPQAETGGKVA